MSDNSTPIAGGDTYTTDDLATINGGASSGVKAPRNKVGFGSDGDFRDVDATHGLPVLPQTISASGSITTQNLVPAGAATAASSVELTLGGSSSIALQVTGTYTAAGGLALQGTIDGTNWVTLFPPLLFNLGSFGSFSTTIASAAVGLYSANVGSMLKVRLSAVNGAVTGTATVTMMGIPDNAPAIIVGQSTASESMSVVLATDQGSVPVTPAPIEGYQTGAASQTALNNNLYVSPAGSGPADVHNYRSIAMQVIQNSGTVTAGAVVFEGSNDGTNWQSVPLYDANNYAAGPMTGFTAVASTNRNFVGPLYFYYFRARISVGFTGTNTGVQAFFRLSGQPFTSDQIGVQDQYITGAASQTTLNNNALLATAGTGSLDCQGFRQIALQITPAAGTVTAGAITFEASNDNVTWISFGLYDTLQGTLSFFNSYTVVAATSRWWVGPLMFRYFRARISTGLTGTSAGVQVFTELRVTPYSPQSMVVASNSGNFPVTVASGTVTTVSTVTTVASSTPVTPTTTFTNSAATVNATSTKGSAGTLWSINVSNINAALRYLKLYNKASAPTVGTDVPVMVIPIPIGGQVTVEGGANGFRFATGIAWALTALAADSDTTVVGVNEHKVAITFT